MILISLFVFFFTLLMTKTMTSTITSRTNSETLFPPDVTNHPNLRLLDPMCGPVTLRATDGNKTGVFEFPWMAQLMYYKEFYTIGEKTKPEFFCSGTIISSRYILTAANCIRQLPSTYRLVVRVGDHDVSKERDCDRDENGQELECAEKYREFDVEKIHNHPEYSRRQHRNNIALIRLNTTIDFKPLNVKPICLPYGTAINLNERKAIVSGWGRVPFGPESEVLLQEKLLLISHEKCNDLHKLINKTISHKQLCAGGLNYTDSWVGESGGPLQAPGIYNGRSVRTVQYGVVSYGLTMHGVDNFPGYSAVYTKVAYYMDWILDTMTD